MAKPRVFEKPLGMKDYLPEDARRKRFLEQTFQQVMERWGYQEVITPTLEYYETVGRASSTLQDRMFKLLDREGHTLVLRPDMTAPIARVVASLPERSWPVRYFYHAGVYRAQINEAGRNAEFYQTGVEYIGEASPMADAEVVALALHCLMEAGISHVRLAIGHVAFLDGVLKERLQEEEQCRNLKSALLNRDWVGYREQVLSAPIPAEEKEQLLILLKLKGGPDKLAEAEQLVRGELSRQGLHNLREIWKLLECYGVEDRVMLDLSMVSSMHYYSGMVFEGYAEGLGFPVLSGGRYDHLLQMFQCAAPATGFAFKVDRLLELLPELPGQEPHLVVAAVGAESARAAIARVQQLRLQQPEAVVELILVAEEEVRGAGQEQFVERQQKRGVQQVIWVREGSQHG